MKARSFLFSIILLFPVLIISLEFITPVQERFNKNTDRHTLNTILEKTADYCERVKDIALFYVCKEKVEDERYLFNNKDLLKFSMSSSDEIEPRRMRKKTYSYEDYKFFIVETEVKY